ncbi:glycosyltransferase family 4 protein [Haloplanus aerogenes]|uniref:Glycosyltransferase family 1 protein n=1 Tax=Haloplanus aerogenes TaxID=660522 RepID=A0A3M0DNN1_9EURY|nr:glycosyltransferase [Haloplanus aerogenes]AZH24758.1 glycosyltransferase family 1 protein [Haloplanus aerogenes]RMB23578.1 glycosyltransferase involved in cell wall biosynthesis [Haloplanus aerogenes]
MHSLHLTTAHTPTDVRIFNKEAISLANEGFDVGILAHDAPAQDQNRIQFFDLGSSQTRVDRWKNIPKVAQIAKRLDPSIYHFHDPELIPVGLYLSRTTDSAVVYDVHEDYGHIATTREWIPNPVSGPLSYILPKIEGATAERFDAIVAVSDWIATPFRDRGIPVTVAHNFPRTESLPPANNLVERDREYVLCYVGGLQELRGIYRMLELLETLLERNIDVELWALGKWSPDENHARVDRFIQQRNLKRYVRFPGYLAYDEMFQHLHSADVGLALLDVEHYKKGVPTKFFEYLYAGLPIVTTPVDAVDAFMPEQYCHVVPQGDTEATADAVETALERDYDPVQMRSLVEAEYSWETEAEKLVNLYEDLLG